ncbi:MAG: hypothetical protein LBS84_01245 [Clostridiales bacterium]|jgi:hypothetical protein|nr:hypothetical protein [Clostridiales bacterium]
MSLVSVFLLAGAFIFIAALGLAARYLIGKRRHNGDASLGESENSVDVTVYAYDSEVNGLDDIRAKRIGVYRDTGVITGIDDESPVYSERFLPTKDNDRELSLLVRGAAEVKRETDKTVIYYFKKIKPLNIKSDTIRVIYNSITRGLEENKPMVLRMTRSAEGDYEQ